MKSILRVICSIIVLTTVYMCGSVEASWGCECKLGFTTYYTQAYRITQIREFTGDGLSCTDLVDECRRYCQEKGELVITQGPATKLFLGGKVQAVGDYLCTVGRNASPRKARDRDLTMYFSLWNCLIPQQAVYVIDKNFCCNGNHDYYYCE